MPIFEYRCNACEHEFEELVRSADEGKTQPCPKCGKPGAGRKMSVFAAHAASAAPSRPIGGPGGCGRCGDPNGPCSL